MSGETGTSMRTTRSGFTLIEMMIVIAIIAIVATIAIPQLQRSRLTANESNAASTLRALAQAQAQMVASPVLDTDDDGAGEYGYLAEMAGTVPLRVSAGGAPAAGAPGDELEPAVLTSAFGRVQNSVVTRSGYVFQVWLPAPTAGGLVGGLAEDANGGKAGGPFPGSDNSEVMWCAYAWPLRINATGTPVFFVSHDGQLLQYDNRGALTYSGIAGGPGFDAAFTTPGDMSSRVALGGVPGVDGNLWRPLR